jgi:DNA processing protein
MDDAANWPELGLASQSVTRDFLQGRWRPSAREELNLACSRGCRTILYSSPDYPELLRHIPDPPLYIYVLGDQELLHRPCVAIVGSRSCSRYGMQACSDISLELSQAGVTVVSGFALGIDTVAHKQAMQGQGRSIGVLGTGLDLIYPASNRALWERMSRSGLLLTEFGPGTRPEAYNFPRRNRIISGLCLGVLVVEAAAKSGSLITARLALEQNREVFALPGPVNLPTYSGCHALIRQGGALVSSAEDILQELAPLISTRLETGLPGSGREGDQPGRAEASSSPAPETLNPDERQVVDVLAGEDRTHIDALAQRLGWESSRVSPVLLVLELRGVVKQLGGMYYCLSSKARPG